MTNDWQDVKNVWVKWGKVGDNIEGTLVDVREVNSQLPGKEGQRTKVYEVKADLGSFHELDNKKNPITPPVQLTPGEIYLVGGRQGIDLQMRRIKIGQKVRVVFAEEKESKKKGFNALKIIKIQTNGQMDEEWLGGREITAEDY